MGQRTSLVHSRCKVKPSPMDLFLNTSNRPSNAKGLYANPQMSRTVRCMSVAVVEWSR